MINVSLLLFWYFLVPSLGGELYSLLYKWSKYLWYDDDNLSLPLSSSHDDDLDYCSSLLIYILGPKHFRNETFGFSLLMNDERGCALSLLSSLVGMGDKRALNSVHGLVTDEDVVMVLWDKPTKVPRNLLPRRFSFPYDLYFVSLYHAMKSGDSLGIMSYIHYMQTTINSSFSYQLPLSNGFSIHRQVFGKSDSNACDLALIASRAAYSVLSSEGWFKTATSSIRSPVTKDEFDWANSVKLSASDRNPEVIRQAGRILEDEGLIKMASEIENISGVLPQGNQTDPIDVFNFHFEKLRNISEFGDAGNEHGIFCGEALRVFMNITLTFDRFISLLVNMARKSDHKGDFESSAFLWSTLSLAGYPGAYTRAGNSWKFVVGTREDFQREIRMNQTYDSRRASWSGVHVNAEGSQWNFEKTSETCGLFSVNREIKVTWKLKECFFDHPDQIIPIMIWFSGERAKIEGVQENANHKIMGKMKCLDFLEFSRNCKKISIEGRRGFQEVLTRLPNASEIVLEDDRVDAYDLSRIHESSDSSWLECNVPSPALYGNLNQEISISNCSCFGISPCFSLSFGTCNFPEFSEKRFCPSGSVPCVEDAEIFLASEMFSTENCAFYFHYRGAVLNENVDSIKWIAKYFRKSDNFQVSVSWMRKAVALGHDEESALILGDWLLEENSESLESVEIYQKILGNSNYSLPARATAFVSLASQEAKNFFMKIFS